MFTVKDFLDLEIVPWHRILSGSDAIDSIPIDYISVIELPVDDFIRENELVLSTALGCEDDPALIPLQRGLLGHFAVYAGLGIRGQRR